MCTEIDELNFDAISDYADWALQSGIWDGRLVSLEDKVQLQDEIAERILNLLLSQNPDSFEFQKMSAQLATIGSDNPYLLEKDIHELHLTQDGIIVQSGFFSPIKNFWKEHKVEILIGVAAVAIVTAVVVVAVCTGGAAARAAAAGGAGLGGLAGSPNNKNPVPPTPGPIEPVNPSDPFERTISGSSALAEPPPVQTRFWHAPFHHRKSRPQPHPVKPEPAFEPPPMQRPFPNLDLYRFDSNQNPPNLPLFPDLPKPTPNIYEQFGLTDKFQPTPDGPHIAAIPDGYDPQRDAIPLEPTPEVSQDGLIARLLHLNESSRSFKLDGIEYPNRCISISNGIGVTFEEAQQNALFLQGFTENQQIEGVYNQTHRAPVDLAEAFVLNYLGITFTKRQHIENWTRFHERNENNPKAKYLQIGHSKATLEIKNALIEAPQEIRDRVIVVTIAPSAVVPDELCYQSFNYASRDIVPYGELFHVGFFDQNEMGISRRAEEAIEHFGELIFLEPHPEAKMMDHEFMSPTYEGKIKEHIDEYNACNGEYE